MTRPTAFLLHADAAFSWQCSDNEGLQLDYIAITATQSAGKLYCGFQHRDSTGIDLLLSNYVCAVADDAQSSARDVESTELCLHRNNLQQAINAVVCFWHSFTGLLTAG